MVLPVWLENGAAEARYALRMIRKTPGVTAIAVLSLALGIGANTAIFSVVDAVLLKLLPVRAPRELYQVASNPARPNTSWNYPDYAAFRDHNAAFSGLAAYSLGVQGVGMQADGGEVTQLAYAEQVSGNYFPVLGVQPALGRLLNPEDDRKPGASPYTVLSYDFWRQRFGGDPRAIGRTVRLNGYPFTIVGVAPRGFRGTDVTAAPNLYIPLMMRGQIRGITFERWNDRHYWFMGVIGRIQPGVSTAQAASQLLVVFKQQEEAERRTLKDQRFVGKAQQILLIPAARGYSFVRNDLEKPLLALMVLVGLVLLIACANVANVMLARGASRTREIALRLAIGAGRWRLTWQLLAESLAIALLGGAAGLALSRAGTRVLLGFVPRHGWNQVDLNVAPDWRLLAFTLGISVLTGVLFGLAPAWQCTRPNLVPALKDETAGGGSRGALRQSLVVVQVALSLLLLIGAGLFVRSLEGLREIDPGFRRDHTMVFTIDPTRNGYKGQRLRDFYQRLLAEAERTPGVRSASLAWTTPLAGSRWNSDVSIEGYQWKAGEKKYIDMNEAAPRYFESMGIPILLGRDFRDQDNPTVVVEPPERFVPGAPRPESPGPRYAIVTESFARRFFAGHNPVGMHLSLDEKYDAATAYEIAGVVKDARYFGIKQNVEPMIYVPLWRPTTSGSRMLVVRTGGDGGGVADAVRRITTAIDPAVPVLETRSMQEQVDNDMVVARMTAALSSFFGLLALLLAGVGLYGVISYAVTRRTREIGIRMALGAQRGSVLWLIARDAALLVVVGVAVAIPAALALTRLVRSFLYGIRPNDPLTMVLGAVVLALVAALASWLPARRATRVDPLIALRYE